VSIPKNQARIKEEGTEDSLGSDDGEAGSLRQFTLFSYLEKMCRLGRLSEHHDISDDQEMSELKQSTPRQNTLKHDPHTLLALEVQDLLNEISTKLLQQPL